MITQTRSRAPGSSTAEPAGAFQYLQREREGRQESPLGHCPVKRPNRRTYQASATEMHTPHRSTEPTHEHRGTCAPLPFLQGVSLMQQEHKTDKKRDTARARMLGKGYSLHSHSKFAWSTNFCLVQMSIELSRQLLLSQCCVHQTVPETTSSSLHVSLQKKKTQTNLNCLDQCGIQRFSGVFYTANQS